MKELYEEENKRSPVWHIVAVFLVLLILVFVIPIASIKWIPQPKNIPSREKVLINAPASEGDLKLDSLHDLNDFVTPLVKHAGSAIASSCSSVSDECYSKAIYWFVRDNIDYVRDPKTEYIESAEAVLLSGSADCDGHAVLVYSLLESVGVDARIAVTSNHAFVQANVMTREYFYKPARQWISIDATCKDCDFGYVGSEYLGDVIDYVG